MQCFSLASPSRQQATAAAAAAITAPQATQAHPGKPGHAPPRDNDKHSTQNNPEHHAPESSKKGNLSNRRHCGAIAAAGVQFNALLRVADQIIGEPDPTG